MYSRFAPAVNKVLNDRIHNLSREPHLMDILQQAPEIRLRRKAHGSIMVYEPQPNS